MEGDTNGKAVRIGGWCRTVINKSKKKVGCKRGTLRNTIIQDLDKTPTTRTEMIRWLRKHVQDTKAEWNPKEDDFDSITSS